MLASDSRTNAGVDYVSTYSKMHVFDPCADRLFVLLTSGNLATSQAVVNAIERDLSDAQAKHSLRTIPRLFEVAQYIGRLSWKEQTRHKSALKRHNISAEANFILAGQIADEGPDIFHIYPQGNYISASQETPFLQIGESKYGKPILDRIISPATHLEDAARCALVSIDSTIRSNISVGPPVDLAIYRKDSFSINHRLTLNLGSAFYSTMQQRWNDGLRHAFDELPRFEWEEQNTPDTH